MNFRAKLWFLRQSEGEELDQELTPEEFGGRRYKSDIHYRADTRGGSWSAKTERSTTTQMTPMTRTKRFEKFQK